MNRTGTNPYRIVMLIVALLFALVILKLGAPIFVKVAIAVSSPSSFPRR